MSAGTIWKFTLQPYCILDMPKGAQVLSVREQGSEICLWAMVDPSAEKEPRRFLGFGTGHDLPEGDLSFVGTAHLASGAMVFHVFEAPVPLGAIIVRDVQELARKYQQLA